MIPKLITEARIGWAAPDRQLLNRIQMLIGYQLTEDQEGGSMKFQPRDRQQVEHKLKLVGFSQLSKTKYIHRQYELEAELTDTKLLVEPLKGKSR